MNTLPAWNSVLRLMASLGNAGAVANVERVQHTHHRQHLEVDALVQRLAPPRHAMRGHRAA